MAATRETILAKLANELEKIRGDQDYELTFDFVERGFVNAIKRDPGKFPVIAVEDSGPDAILARDTAGTRYATDLDFVVYLRKSADLEGDLNKAIATVRQFLNVAPSLGSRSLALFDLDLEDRGALEERNLGRALIGARLIYYDPHPSVTTPVGSEVYGTGWIKTLYDWLGNELDELAISLASGYAYGFENVYSRHHVAELRLPAVTYSLVNATAITEDETEFGVDDDSAQVRHQATFQVRIHTAWQGGRFDDYAAAAVANSVANKLLANLADSTIDVLTVTDIQTNRAFEGGTLGAELTVTLATYADHSRE